MLNKTNVFHLAEAKDPQCKISEWILNRVSLSVKALIQCLSKFFPTDYLESVKELGPQSVETEEEYI